MPTTADESQQAQYLTFLIADEEYAIGILRMKEIIEFDTLTKLPAAPPGVRGVMNLRGSVVPVVDLAVRFGLGERPITRRTCVIIVEVEVEGEQVVMGIIADSVSQVVDFPPDAIEPPPPFGTRVRMDHLLGMGRLGKKFVLILDVDRVLSENEVGALGRVSAGEAPAA